MELRDLVVDEATSPGIDIIERPHCIVRFINLRSGTISRSSKYCRLVAQSREFPTNDQESIERNVKFCPRS